MARWQDKYYVGQLVEYREFSTRGIPQWIPAKVIHKTRTGLPHVRDVEYPERVFCADRKGDIRISTRS